MCYVLVRIINCIKQFVCCIHAADGAQLCSLMQHDAANWSLCNLRTGDEDQFHHEDGTFMSHFHAVDCSFQLRLSETFVYIIIYKVIISVSYCFCRMPGISATYVLEIICCWSVTFIFVWLVNDFVVCHCSILNLPLVRHFFLLAV